MASWRSGKLWRRGLEGFLIGAVIVTVALAASVLARKPRNDRDWQPHLARTASATIHRDGSVSLHNVRDWSYGDGVVVSDAWTERTVDPADITNVYFLVQAIQDKPVAHTFLSFRFKRGAGLAFSVEARLVKNETWKPVRGAFRNYELAYQWGTERDFIGGRALYNRVRLYPVALKPQTARKLFLDLVDETNALAQRPRFYNTLTDNCTNTLAYIVNRHKPHTLPWSLSWYLTADSDLYLMRQGFIAMDGGTPDRTRALHDLTPYRARIAAMEAGSAEQFSADLATLPPARRLAPSR